MSRISMNRITRTCACLCLMWAVLCVVRAGETLIEDPSFERVKQITSFEDRNPFEGGVVVTYHATDGRNALRVDRSYAVMDGMQDWTGYDTLKADLYTDAKEPLTLSIEIRDTATRGYWTRVNYTTLVLPVTRLYVGEKSRPGRMLMLDGIKRILHRPDGDPFQPTEVERHQGYRVFCRDFMKDLFYNDTPFKQEIGRPLPAEAFAGPATLHGRQQLQWQ
jgi:hypothetical protein